MPVSKTEYETMLEERAPSNGRRQVTATDLRELLISLLESTVFPDELDSLVSQLTGPMAARLAQLEEAIAILGDGGQLIAPELVAAASIAPAVPVIGEDLVITEPLFGGVEPISVSRSVTIDGADMSEFLVDLTLSGTVIEPGTLVLEWTATGPGGRMTVERIEIFIGARVQIEAPAAFDPAAPTEGENVRLVSPVVSGSAPISVELDPGLGADAVTLGGVALEPYAVGEELFVDLPAGSAGEALVVSWRATGPGLGNTMTSAATAVVAAVGVEPVIVAPTVTGSLQDITVTQGSAPVAFDAGALVDDGGGTLTFSLPTPRSGVTIDSATGQGSIDPSATGTLAAISVVVRATNEVDAVDLGFSLTVEAAAPAYTPTIVEWHDMQLAVTTAAGADAGYLLVQASQAYMDAGEAQNAHMWRAVKYGGTSSLRTNAGGQATVAAIYETATGTSPANSSSAMSADLGEMMGTLFLMRVDLARQTLWAMTGDSPMAQRDQDTLNGVVRLPIRDTPMTLGANNKRTQSSGYAVFALDSLPDGWDPVANRDRFFDADGNCVDPAVTAAYLGAQPLISTVGKTADQLAAGQIGGTETGPVTVQASTGGSFTTIQEGSGGSGGGVQPSDFVTASTVDAELLDGSYQAKAWLPDDSPVLSKNMALKNRLVLRVDRPSIVLGEACYLWVDGLTEEEKALWLFQWTFDTSGEFSSVASNPTHKKVRNRATGHHQCGGWDKSVDQPGNKVPKVRVIPPPWSGIDPVLLDVTVENRDPEIEFAGKTIYVGSAAALQNAPAGATTYGTIVEAMAARRFNAGGYRLMIPRNEVSNFTPTDNVSEKICDTAMTGGICFGAYGPGTGRAEVFLNTGDVGTSSRTFLCDSSNGAPKFLLVEDWYVRGRFDVVSGDYPTNDLFRVGANFPVTFNNVKTRKTYVSFTNQSSNVSALGMMAVVNCDVSEWGNYGIYTGQGVAPGIKVLIRGSYVCQSPNAVNGYEAKEPGAPGNQPDHGPVRITQADDLIVVVSQCRMASFNGWSAGGAWIDNLDAPVRSHQPCIRLGALNCENTNALINDNHFEGGAFSLGGGNSGYIVGSGFLNFFGNYYIKGPNSGVIGLGMSGPWIHDNIVLCPNGAKELKNGSSFRFIEGIGCERVTDTWASKDFRVFGNTFIFLPSTQTLSYATGVFGNPPSEDELISLAFDTTHASMPSTVLENNLLWTPNMTLRDEASPRVPEGMYSLGLYGPAPQYTARRQELSTGAIQVDEVFATPPSDAIIARPGAGSSLWGTATGNVAAGDYFGRPRETRDPGAISDRFRSAA